MFFCRDSLKDYTPLMEAAVEGHEIIVQYFLQHVSHSSCTAACVCVYMCVCAGQATLHGVVFKH